MVYHVDSHVATCSMEIHMVNHEVGDKTPSVMACKLCTRAVAVVVSSFDITQSTPSTTFKLAYEPGSATEPMLRSCRIPSDTFPSSAFSR